VTDFDLDRLRKLLQGARLWSSRDREHLEQLDEELDHAHVVAATDIPPEVVLQVEEILYQPEAAGDYPL
jgi:regulator of nucleoside diphosphate kinase